MAVRQLKVLHDDDGRILAVVSDASALPRVPSWQLYLQPVSAWSAWRYP
jgi:hypothetical protein